MARDVNAIGQKLSPRNLAQDAVESVSYQARETGSRVVDFIRANPLPVAAVGLGVTWLIRLRSSGGVSGDRMARYAYTGPERRGRPSGVGRHVGELTSQAKEKVSHARETVSSAADTVTERAEGLAERVGEFAGRAQDRVQDLGSQARQQVTRARSSMEQLIDENPLAVAAGAALIGLALGLLLPGTEREREVLGPTRDRLADRASEAAERVKEVASEAARDVKQTVQEEWSERKPELQSTVQEATRHVVDEVKDAADRVKDEAKEAVKPKGQARRQGGAEGNRGTGQ